MLNRWFKKEMPLLGMLGMGGGVGSNLLVTINKSWGTKTIWLLFILLVVI